MNKFFVFSHQNVYRDHQFGGLIIHCARLNTCKLIEKWMCNAGWTRDISGECLICVQSLAEAPPEKDYSIWWGKWMLKVYYDCIIGMDLSIPYFSTWA